MHPILLKLCIYIHQGICPIIFFFVVSFLGFGVKIILASQNECGKQSFLSILWNSLWHIDDSSFLKVWYYSAVNTTGPGLFYVGRFCITASVSLLIIELFQCFISYWFNLSRAYDSRNLSISSRYSTS
jgi:hypothetical protein